MEEELNNIVKITVESNGRKVTYEFPTDSDIYEYADILRQVLTFVTFQAETIDKVIVPEEEIVDNS